MGKREARRQARGIPMTSRVSMYRMWRDTDRVVILIEDDGCGRPFQLPRDDAFGGADFTESHLLLAPGIVVFQAIVDDEAPVHLRELFLRRPLLVLVGGRLLVAAVRLGHPVEKVLHHVTILERVTQWVAVVGARLLQELVEVIVPGRALILAVNRRNLIGGGRTAILLVFPIIEA